MPSETRYVLAERARRSPKAKLYSAVPRSSLCPSIVTAHVEYFLSTSALAIRTFCPSSSMASLSYLKKTGARIPFLLTVSISSPASGSEETTGVSGGSTGGGSGGVGGAGRVGVTDPGNCPGCEDGGVVPPATGGFLPPQAAMTASSPTTTNEDTEERDIGVGIL